MKVVALLILVCICASAQKRSLSRGVAPPDSRGSRRLGLVIGNEAYPDNPLHNAVNDARAMKSALEDAGFTVQMKLNATQQQLETTIDEFTGGVNPGDIALFFYAGHGMQITDQNYLIPVDFQARTAVDAKYKAYPAQRVQENLEAAGAAMQIIVLDACRNNPFRSWRGGGDGLAAMQAGRGTYIAFATSPGKTAGDRGSGQNGLFTGELINVLREPGLSIDQVFNRVRDQVAKKSQGQQLPWSTSSVTGEFYFKVTIEGTVSVAPPRDLTGERELAFWNSIKDENDPVLYQEYLRRYPNGEFATIATAKLNRLKTASAPTRVEANVGDPKTTAKPSNRVADTAASANPNNTATASREDFRATLLRWVAEAETNFDSRPAGRTWDPKGTLLDSHCVGWGTGGAPFIRCSWPAWRVDQATAERQFNDIVAKIRAALPGWGQRDIRQTVEDIHFLYFTPPANAKSSVLVRIQLEADGPQEFSVVSWVQQAPR